MLEALEFLAAAREFGLSGGQAGIRKALSLVWSSESSIRDAVKNVYIRLYLSSVKELSASIRDPLIVHNLLALVDGASCGELASLEEMVVMLMDSGHIPKSVVIMLWDTFSGRVADTDSQTIRYAMLLLSMVGRADPQVVRLNLNLLVEQGLKQEAGSPDLILARNCCLALQRLATPKAKRSSEQPFRLPSTHPAFVSLSRLMMEQVGDLSSSQWCPFAEQAINTVYKLSEQPDELFTAVLKKLCSDTLRSREEDSSADRTSFLPLARLLFAAGHIAQQQLVHLEVSISTELKRRRAVREEKEAAARRTPLRRRSRRISGKVSSSGSL